ncbi:hypothetical protein ScPMuIL_000762 [Solemya velum]
MHFHSSATVERPAEMAVQVPGLIGIVVSYLVVLAVGLWSGRRKGGRSVSKDDPFLANRQLGLVISIFTMTATEIGASFITGIAEEMARNGVLWLYGPVCYSMGICIAACVYLRKMRNAGYYTIFDPIQTKYGAKMGGLLFIPEFIGELFWEASILVSLGATLSVILDLNSTITIIISACVAVVYTFFGGLYSVAYTDVVQLILVFIGLILGLSFALTNPAVDFSRINDTWIGHVPTDRGFIYADDVLMLIGGGIPWQSYYQRALACKTNSIAICASVLSVIITIFAIVPPALFGAIGAATEWNSTDYGGEIPIPDSYWVMAVPMVLQHLCPTAVAVIGIGAVSAAGMSSTDSIILSTGTVFARNIYKNIIRPKATEREVIWILRFSILMVGVVGAVVAITVNSVIGLYILSGDLMYVILFPQLTCALWVHCANTYGSLVGFIVSLTMRLLAGEPLLDFPATIRYPYYHESLGQLFPHKTFVMIIHYVCIIAISFTTDTLFKKSYLPLKYDVLRCFGPIKDKQRGESCADADASDESFELETAL